MCAKGRDWLQALTRRAHRVVVGSLSCQLEEVSFSCSQPAGDRPRRESRRVAQRGTHRVAFPPALLVVRLLAFGKRDAAKAVVRTGGTLPEVEHPWMIDDRSLAARGSRAEAPA